MRFAADCWRAYRSASRKTRRLFNQAVFDLLFSTGKFEYGELVAPTGFEPALPP